MKIIHSTGRILEVRDVGPVIFRLTAGAVPIKVNGWSIIDDEAARETLRGLLDTGLYVGGRVDQ